jgi:hypothetical protein
MRHLGMFLLLLLCMARGSAGATLKGKVVDANGNPVPGLKLVVSESLTRANYLMSSDERGGFEQSLAAGTYSIALSKPDSDVVLIRLESSEDRRIVLRLEKTGLTAVSSTSSMQAPESPDTDPSLAQIRDYEVQTSQDNTPVPQARGVEEAVNPFPAQKGGRFHGSIYEFHRNDNFDARNFFDPVGQALPEYKRNQFGVSLAVALRRNLNLLGTYEGLRIIQGSTLLSHIPTAQM